MKLSASQSFRLPCTVETAFDDTLDATHWPEFAGWWFIPGIVSATQNAAGPVTLGTRHNVTNSDGSHHSEEIVALDRPRTHTRRVFGLTGAFSLIVRQMEEIWTFSPLASGCDAKRVFYFELTNRAFCPIGLFLLVPFREAMKRHAARIAARLGGR